MLCANAPSSCAVQAAHSSDSHDLHAGLNGMYAHTRTLQHSISAALPCLRRSVSCSSMLLFDCMMCSVIPDSYSNAEMLHNACRPEDQHAAATRCICIETTHNRCGGTVLPLDYLDQLHELAQSQVGLSALLSYRGLCRLNVVHVAKASRLSDSLQHASQMGANYRWR